MDKFNENMSLIKNLPADVERELKKAYLKGEGFRGQDIEDYITEKWVNEQNSLSERKVLN